MTLASWALQNVTNLQENIGRKMCSTLDCLTLTDSLVETGSCGHSNVNDQQPITVTPTLIYVII